MEEFDLFVDGYKLHARKETDGKIIIDVPNTFLYRNSSSNGQRCERHEQILYPNGRNPANLYTQYTPFKTLLKRKEPLSEEDITIVTRIACRPQRNTPRPPKPLSPLRMETLNEEFVGANFDKTETTPKLRSAEDALLIHNMKRRQ